MRALILVFLFLSSKTSLAQFTYTLDSSVPVINGTQLSMPWAGGLNAAQFNTIDLNGDNLNDLAIFDRTSSRVITFLQIDNQYQYAPEYEMLFPADVSGWMLLRDYNGDGRKDIFTRSNVEIKVYKNITPPGENLQWEVFLFAGNPGSEKSETLLTTGFSGKINLPINSNDLPSINDADGDGDLDLFVPFYPGGNTIEFHKNLSVENNESLDSLDFARTPQTQEAWGGVRDCDCNEFAFNDEPCDAGGRTNHTGGKTLFAFDIDNDGDQDMLFSEEGHANEGGCPRINLLHNDGTNATAIITSSSLFPDVSPVFMSTSPAAYYEDVDFDGKKDMIISPNVAGRETLQTNFKQSIRLYKNTGSTALPVFSTPNTDFMQENMIDVGDNAVPAFYDSDSDGDLDLFVGCYANNFIGSIYFFENKGTQADPSFEFMTSDFWGLSSYNLINIKPSFADMNGDATIDLVFTATPLYGGPTRLYYIPNSSSRGLAFGQSPVAITFTTDPVKNVTITENICVTDVNRDLKNDLLIGRYGGKIEYWQNIGTATNPAFTLEDDDFLQISTGTFRQHVACAIGDLNADGKTDLIIGDDSGKTTIISDYRNAEDASEGVTNSVYNPLLQTYGAPNLGGKIWPTVANIFRTDKPALMLGNIQGGLHLLKNELSTALPESPLIDVYPNPVSKESDLVTIKVDRPAVFITVSMLGQEIGTPVNLQAFQEYNFHLNTLPKGVYLLYFSIDGKSIIRRIVVF